MEKWTVTKREYLEKNEWIKLRKDSCKTPDGHTINDYYVMELRDVSCTVAITKDKEIIFVKEYKQGVEDTILQLPCGYIDEGEEPLQAAKRELLEETGYKAKKWILLGKQSGSPGRLNHYYYFFLALDSEKIQEQKLDKGENVHVILCNKIIADKILRENLSDLVTPAGFYLAKKWLEKL